MLPILFAFALATAAPPAPEAPAPASDTPIPIPVVETGCGLVVEGPDGKKAVIPPSPDVRVLGVGGSLSIAAPEGQKLIGLMCHRSSVVPDAGDDRVIQGLHVPLYIAGNGVTAKLSLADGAYALKALDGTWAPEDQPKIDAVLALFKSRL